MIKAYLISGLVILLTACGSSTPRSDEKPSPLVPQLSAGNAVKSEKKSEADAGKENSGANEAAAPDKVTSQNLVSNDQSAPMVPAKEQAAENVKEAAPSKLKGLAITEKPSSKKTETSKLPEVKIPRPTAHAEGATAEQSLKWLRNGNTRFLKGYFRKDGASRADIERLASGQKPHAIVLSCSDSRVPPEIVFDQKLGEIFTVRNAGETLDTATVASMEYAVEHLGSKVIVVMGHTECGAVKATLAHMDQKDLGTASLNQLATSIEPRLASFKGKSPSKGYEEEGWAEARGVAQDILKYSTLIQEKVSKGEVQIVPALYHLDSGAVEWAK